MMNSLILLDTFLLVVRVFFLSQNCASAIDHARFKSCKNRKLESVSLKTWKAKSRIQCADKCLGENACSSANYEADERECELFDDVIPDRDCDSFVFNNKTTFLIMRRTLDTTGSTQTTEAMGTTEKVNPCNNNQQFNGSACDCQAPLSGQYCEIGPRDCNAIKGKQWLDIYPEDGIGKITVFCYDNLLIIFTVPKNGLQSNLLNRNWDDFKNGFGNIDNKGNADGGGYWLGNINIHRITNSALSYSTAV